MQNLVQTAKDNLYLFSALFEVIVRLNELGSEPSTGRTPTEKLKQIICGAHTHEFSHRTMMDWNM